MLFNNSPVCTFLLTQRAYNNRNVLLLLFMPFLLPSYTLGRRKLRHIPLTIRLPSSPAGGEMRNPRKCTFRHVRPMPNELYACRGSDKDRLADISIE